MLEVQEAAQRLARRGEMVRKQLADGVWRYAKPGYVWLRGIHPAHQGYSPTDEEPIPHNPRSK